MLEQYKWRANPVGELAYFYLKTTWRPATTHADLMTIWLNAPAACPKCLARLPGCQGHCALETRSLRALQKPSTLKALDLESPAEALQKVDLERLPAQRCGFRHLGAHRRLPSSLHDDHG